MPITTDLNKKSNVRFNSAADLSANLSQPVIARYNAISTAGQTTISLPFLVDQSNTDACFVFVNGQKLTIGSSNDYIFSAIDGANSSSLITLSSALTAGLNIEVFKMGLKREIEFQTDSRFTQMYDLYGAGFQGFVDESSRLTATSGTPTSTQFKSTVINRASIPDIANDLKARIGIERIITQQIYQIQNEFGPNGEPVWGALNDDRGLIRFVGNWFNQNDNYGIRAYSSNSTSDYVEITFYGTGLNLLHVANPTGYAYAVSIDNNIGVSETTYVTPTTTSNILGVRNYSSNQQINVGLGLTLGLHTVRIRNATTTSSSINCYGFEVLNESSSVNVRPGIAYQNNKKVVSSAVNSIAYNSVATGTKGGRVLVYQKSDGTVGQSWQAVDSGSPLYLTNANHTNEEVVRAYHLREFGAGRGSNVSNNFTGDDFSTLTSSVSSRAFTLDDGTTTLAGNAVNTNQGSGLPEGLYLNASGSFWTFTFIGTGIDIVQYDSGSGTDTTLQMTIDGSSVGTYTTGSTSMRTVKIASGLSYGTHVLRLTRAAGSTLIPTVVRFIVYQPKKPSLPSGAVELADYNVMADYVLNSTANVLNLGTGVLRKVITREATYVGTWSISSVATSEISGFSTNSSTTGDYVQFVFFGTGFEYRFSTDASTPTWRITIDGSFNLSTSNSSPVGGAGWSGAVSADTNKYGTGISTWTSSSGTLVLAASASNSNGIRVNGLSIGLHTVKIEKTAGTGNIYNTGFDIVTPIHSHKPNLYADIQNTLLIGSQGITDNRRFTPIKEALPSQKSWVQAVGVTANPTTTVSSYVPCPDMSVTIKTNGQPIQIQYSISITNNGGSYSAFRVYVDGIAVGVRKGAHTGSGLNTNLGDTIIVPVSAGTHKVDIYWLTFGNILTAETIDRGLIVREL